MLNLSIAIVVWVVSACSANPLKVQEAKCKSAHAAIDKIMKSSKYDVFAVKKSFSLSRAVLSVMMPFMARAFQMLWQNLWRMMSSIFFTGVAVMIGDWVMLLFAKLDQVQRA